MRTKQTGKGYMGSTYDNDKLETSPIVREGFDISVRSKTPMGAPATQLNKTFSNNAAHVKQNLEAEYEEKYMLLKEQYDARLKSLHEQIAKIHESIGSDELITAMKESETSSDYVGQRIKEIVEENVAAEREMYIQKLTEELAFTKGEVSRLSKTVNEQQLDMQELQHSLDMCKKEKETALTDEVKSKQYLEVKLRKLESEFANTSNHYEQIVRAREEETRGIAEQHLENYSVAKQEAILLEQKLDDALKELEAYKRDREDAYNTLEKVKVAYRSLEEQSRQLTEENLRLKDAPRKLEAELNAMRAVNFECGLRLKQLDEDKKKADETVKKAEKEREGLVEKFNSYGDQLQKASSETVESLLNKQKMKRAKLQKKIIELKGIIGKLEEEVLQHKRVISEIKATYEGTITGLHDDMKKIKDEWEKKVYEQDLAAQRKLTEVQSQQALQIANLQDEYQTMLDTKLSEIQTEAQSQINKTKTSHIEMKSLFESKMQTIEKSYVPIAKHEQILEEERKKTKEIFDRELSSERDEYEKELNARLLSADAEKTREIEQLTQVYKQNVATLNDVLNKAKRNIESYEEKFEKIEAEKEAFEESNQQLIKDKKKLIEQTKEIDGKVQELAKELEEEKRLRREAEIRSKATKENAGDIMEKYEKANSLASILEGECNAMKQKLADIDEEKAVEARNCKALQSEKEALQDAIRRLEEDKRQLGNKLQKQIEELTDESQSLHTTTMQMRQRENEKLEKEIKDHMQTKNQLLQAEAKVRNYSEEIVSRATKLKEMESTISELEEAFSNSKNKVYELETQNQLIESELHSSIEQYKELMQIHNEIKSKIRRDVANNIFSLKEELQYMKSVMMGSIANAEKDLINKLERVILMQKKCEIVQEKVIKEKIVREKDSLKEELRREMESKESEFLEQSMSVNGKFEIMIKEKNAEIKQLQLVCEELENKNKMLFKDISELQSKIKISQTDKMKLERENEKLKKETKANNDKLSSIKTEIKDQTLRLKVDAENALTVAKQELDTRYKKQLNTLQKEIETLKLDSNKELRSILGDVTNLKLQNQYEKEQTIQSYENNMEQMEFSLKIEKEKTDKFKQENERLQQEVESSKEEHKSELYQLESKMKHLNQSLMTDTEKYKKLKANRNDEIDKQNKRIRELTAELTLKTEVIEELTKEKEAQRAQMKELKLDLELQESQFEKRDTDYTKVISKKEQEIEELHKLLSRSYSSASSSLDKVKLASRLENETKELAKKVKEASMLKSQKDRKAGQSVVIPDTSGAPVRGSIEANKSSDERRSAKSPLSISQLNEASPAEDSDKRK